MGWLIHNPIADMYGHDFLLFYGGIIVLTLVACWLKLRQSDPTASMPLPPVPSEPNPYETAYLRGGENEVTRVVIFGLTQRGYLQVTEEADKRIEQAPDHPDPAHLPQLERAVFEALQIPLSAEDIFKSVSLSSTVRSYCTTLRADTSERAITHSRRGEDGRQENRTYRGCGYLRLGRLQATHRFSEGLLQRGFPYCYGHCFACNSLHNLRVGPS